jgi:putative salt-induced outer membrane protein YdiY
MTYSVLRRIPINKSVLLLLFLMLIGGAYQALAEPEETFTDRVYLKNGDRITGSIKELDRGKLRVKTETMNTVYLHWVDVQSVDSTTYLRISVTDGSFRYGRLLKADKVASVRVFDGKESVEIPALQISGMQPLRVDQTFLRQLEGDISAGVDYKQASDILLVNVASSLRLRQENYEIELDLHWNETQRSLGNNTSRAYLTGDYTRILEDRYFWKAMAAFERNEELGLDLRSLLGGTGGRYFVQTDRMHFQVNGGLAISAEDRTDGKSQDSLEGVIRSSFDYFVLSTPMTRLSANVSLFPGITESGRIRINTNIKLRNEFVRDFFWDLSFYSNYDNQPARGADKRDYGVITSLGATF